MVMPVSLAKDSPIRKSLLPCMKKVAGPLSVNARKAFFTSCAKVVASSSPIRIGDDDATTFAQEVKNALRAFTDNGPATFFIHGNRDFLIGESFAKETGITILPDPYTLTINDQKVVISHD